MHSIAAPRPAGESEKISRSAVVTPSMTSVEAEQYSGKACDNDDSDVCRATHGISLMSCPTLLDAC
jgi:hypothetical protein